MPHERLSNTIGFVTKLHELHMIYHDGHTVQSREFEKKTRKASGTGRSKLYYTKVHCTPHAVSMRKYRRKIVISPVQNRYFGKIRKKKAESK